jgi:hypothetical protein
MKRLMMSVGPLAALLLTLFLAACSSLPLPAEVDLRSRLGAQSEGEFEEEIVAGELDTTRRLPDDGGECVDFSDADIAVTVESAQVHYNLDVTYDGPELSGRVQAQLYLAGTGDPLWESSNRIGPTVTLNLDKTATRLAGTAVLGPNQLEAINESQACWGVQVTGHDAVVQESGTARFSYVVNDLRLRITFSVI